MSFNSDPGSAARSRIVTAFIDHFFGGEYLPAPPEPVDVDLSQYAGEYLSLRRNQSTFEKLTMLVSGVTVSADGEELIVASGGINRWIAMGEDVFRGKYSTTPLVFIRDENDAISHMVINGPLGTYERVGGFDSPAFLQMLLAAIFALSIAATLGYGYRLVRKRASLVIARGDAFVVTIYSVLAILLYGYLGATLAGDTQEFAYGVPTAAHAALLMMSVNALVGLAVVFLAGRQWVRGDGTLAARSVFSLFALGALANIWIGFYFNIVSYAFS